MMQIERGESLRALEESRSLFQEKAARDFKPLASPTTPFQFEARQQQQSRHGFSDQNSSLFDDAARLQNTIQLQLLSYIKSFHGVQQQPSNLYTQQQQHHRQVSNSEYLHRFHQQQQHPTIALLQERFQRLERDKEMRHTKQLYSNQVLEPAAAKFPSLATTFSQSPCSSSSFSSTSSSTPSTTISNPAPSADCNLHLALAAAHNSSIIHDSRLKSSTTFATSSSSFLTSHTIFPPARDHNKLEATGGDVNDRLGKNNSVLLSFFPENCDHSKLGFTVPVNPSSSLSVHSHSETSLLLKDGKNDATVSKNIIPIAADRDEVDTSLHL